MVLNGFKAIPIICFSAVLAACSSSDSVPLNDDTPEEQNVHFNGPGSVWNFELGSDGRFAIERREDLASAVDMTVNGDWTRLSTGFMHLSVNEAAGDEAPSVGDTAWGIEIPGFVLFLAPIKQQSEQIIPMVTAGACPEANLNANWVLVKKSGGADASDPERDFFGTFTYNAATEMATIPQKYALESYGALQSNDQLGGAECASGIMDLTEAGAVMYLTDNGGAIVHVGVDDGDDGSFIFAFNKKAIGTINNLDGQYAGVLFDESLGNGDKIAPVNLTCDAGLCSADVVTDIETGATNGEATTINLTSTPDELEQGMVTGTIANNGSVLACMADIAVNGGSDKIITCVGQSPSDETKMFNVIVRSL